MASYNRSIPAGPGEWNRRWQQACHRAAWGMPEPIVREVAAGILHERHVQHVLDLGCGVGRHALMLARAGFAVTAIDAAPAGLTVLREAAARERLDIAVDAGLMTDLPYAPASFDYVLAFNVIDSEGSAALRRAIAEIHRVLRPSGLYQGTMLSKRHAAFGQGLEVATDGFIAECGSEGVARPIFCNAREVTELFAAFEPLRLEDRCHSAPGARYWHLLAERRP